MTQPAPNSPSIQRPAWLPGYLPEFDGLRGLAMIAVVLYHCHTRLVGTWIYGFSLWGWSGVSMFFFLSGFLITGNLLATRNQKKYFHNFHARRALRIWPLYILLLIVVYLNSDWFIGPPIWQAVKTAPWLCYIFFLQNLFPIALPSAIGPTWALAIEEQFYFLWAPAVRWLRRPWMLGLLLTTALVVSPVVRRLHPHWITPTHTLIHLDALALGCLVALGLYTLGWARRTWLALGITGFVAGIAAAATVAGGTAYLDSALAVGYGGLALALAVSTGSRSPIHWLFNRGPLAYYGKISYGLYLCHISVFIYFGWFDLRMDHYGTAGNVAIVCFRMLLATLVATALWYGVEKQILKLKKHF
jgi:peptidoglycan/LPS O-acetylase OafA/YrhL